MINLPRQFEKFPDKPKENFGYYFEKWVKTSTSNEEKVCNKCYYKYKDIKKVCLYFEVFQIIGLDIVDIETVSKVCKVWNKSATYYFSYFREIQYLLPFHVHTPNEKKILWNNRNYLPGHSKLLLELFKSTDWNDSEQVKEVLKIANEKKQKDCWDLMCTRYCNETFQIEDCLEMLLIPNTVVKSMSIKKLSELSIHKIPIYLPLIIEYLKYNKNNDLITNFLINISMKTISLRVQIYWLLTVKIDDKKHGKYFLDMRAKIIYSIHKIKNSINVITCGYRFISLFQSIENYNLQDIMKHVKNNKKKIFGPSIVLPINTSITCNDIIENDMKLFNSATKPIMISCSTTNKYINNYRIIYKKEDIRKDYIILQIIKLIDLILKEEEKLDLNIVTYNILSTSSNDGFIEMVPDSDTIYDIKEKMNYTVLNYIMENNKDKTVDQIRNKFMKSTAAYCVITYILGIGDRHLDNIMVTKNGELFHIDYDFILGFDPKLTNPHMRIIPEMVDALGGLNSSYYHEFKEICSRSYNCLRRHYRMFICFFYLLLDSSPKITINNTTITKQNIDNFITSRLLPGQSYREAQLHICSKIENSSNYYFSIIDFFHRHKKESVIGNIFTNSIGKISDIIVKK